MTAPIQQFAIASFGWDVVVANVWLGVVIALVTLWSRD